jgi:glycosyltransferase involved in cell wall biosynthesis
MVQGKSIRILHVFGAMNRGGAETWIMHVLRSIDHRAFKMDFLVHDRKPGVFDEEIKSLGSKIFYGSSPKNPVLYAKSLKRILTDQGPYDVIHSHVHHYSGWILHVAKTESIRIRIAHSHSDTRPLNESASVVRRLYLWLTSRLIANSSTHGLACSRTAAAALFGEGWESEQRWSVLSYGLDFSPFRTCPDRAQVRKELGIPENSPVVGHVGRFVKAKNHTFFVKIAEEIVKRDPDVVFLLVGDGPEFEKIKQRAESRIPNNRFIFTGSRPDVPKIMMGSMDVFLFPSLYEGLPVSYIEAQAAGLPCVVSEAISKEADIVEERTVRLSLQNSARKWADILHTQLLDRPTRAKKEEALNRIMHSPFTIEKSVKGLMKIYSA